MEATGSTDSCNHPPNIPSTPSTTTTTTTISKNRKMSGKLRPAHYQVTPVPVTPAKPRKKKESQEEPTNRRKSKTTAKGGRFKSAPGRQRTSSPALPMGGGLTDKDEFIRPTSGVSTLSGVSKSESRHQCFQTISRTSSKKSQSDGAQSKQAERGESSASESEADESHKATKTVAINNVAVDIVDEKAWDTDLEPDDVPAPFDHSGRTAYVEACKRLDVVPVSFFLRHMHDKQLDMKHHGLTSSGMKAICSVLISNTTILALDLSDNWLGQEGGLAVCDMIKENCFITDLNLSENRLNKCAAELCHFLSLNDTLRKLNLSGNGFDDKSAEHLAEFITSSSRVEYLDLSHNNLCEGAGLLIGPALSDNACLKELDLSWNHLRRKGATAIAQGVKNNVYMKKISLAWNGLGLEGASALGDALKANTVLEELDVMNNRITTEGAVIIGKGLTLNETLKVLKIGKNPIKSAGCWGICAAILKNPNCALSELDFCDVLVDKDFDAIFKQVQESLPQLKMRHGGMEAPLKPKARMHPMMKVMAYIEKHNLRLVDFFNKFDKDGSMSVTHEEFRQGLQETGIQLPEEEIVFLLEDLDRDGDGEINYSELVIGHTDFQEKEKQMQNIMTTLRPMTS